MGGPGPFPPPDPPPFDGTLNLPGGIPPHSAPTPGVLMLGDFNGRIDLQGADVAGTLFIFGGGDGQIVNVDDRMNHAAVIHVCNYPDCTFSGTISVGAIREHAACECHGIMSGTIQAGQLQSGAQIWLPGFEGTAANLPYGARIVVTGDAGPNTLVTVMRVQGQILIGGAAAGDLDVTANVLWRPDAEPNISIGGDLTSTGHIVVGEALDGEIHVHGALLGDVGHAVDVGGPLGADAAIVVDWDGDDLYDYWGDDATVRVDGVVYEGNTPAQRVYEITCVKGDLTNDAIVDAFDIDPFVMVLVDGWAALSDYDLAFPGLRGSALYHADLDCDGAVTSADLAPFIERLGDPQSYIWCETCPSPPPGGESLGESVLDPGDPAAVAAFLKEQVAPERLPYLAAIAAQLAAESGDAAQGDFWAIVAAALAP